MIDHIWQTIVLLQVSSIMQNQLPVKIKKTSELCEVLSSSKTQVAKFLVDVLAWWVQRYELGTLIRNELIVY